MKSDCVELGKIIKLANIEVMFQFLAFCGINYYSCLCPNRDLAARNCLVTPDLSVKIGDYGTGIETFKVSNL
jgi:hypothetical protein